MNAAWRAALSNPLTRKCLLVTIVPSSTTLSFLWPSTGIRHPAELPGAILATTHLSAHPTMGALRFPFWPTLLDWPSITRRISPAERRAEISTAQIALTADSGIGERAIRDGLFHGGLLQVDFWYEGCNLDKTELIFRGIIDDAQYNEGTQGASFSAKESPRERSVQYPPGDAKIDRDAFRDVPLDIAGRFGRQIIIGPFPYPVYCPQIARNRFYICDHKLTRTPQSVTVNGEDVEGDKPFIFGSERIQSGKFSVFGGNEYYSYVEFPDEEYEPGTGTVVAVADGVGISPNQSPFITLLEDVGGYRIEPYTRARLSRITGTSVLLNATGSLESIIFERLAPQTQYIMTWKNGEAYAYSLTGDRVPGELGLDSGIYGLRDEGRDITSEDQIANAIEIKFERNVFALEDLSASRFSKLIDASTAPWPLSGLLKYSESLYGRRYRALELPDTFGASHDEPPRSAVALARDLLLNTALPHRIYPYLITHEAGFRYPLNSILNVTDPNEGLSSTEVRVIESTLLPTGWAVKLMTTDRFPSLV